MNRGVSLLQGRRPAARAFRGGFALVPALFLIVVVGLLTAVAVRGTPSGS